MNPKIELAIMVVAAILAGVILKFGFSGARAFEEAALGILTVGYEGKNEAGQVIHTVKQREDEIESMLASIQLDRETILFLGNSQTHSINQWEEGQVNYPEILSNQTESHNILANSLPNANLQEFHLIANWWMDTINIHQLVIPVFMDDLREDGLRKDFVPAILASDFELPRGKDINDKINRDLDEIRRPIAESAIEGGQKSEWLTPQDKVERRLNDALGKCSEVWRNRPNARGDFFLTLYRLRNTIFGINASTKRNMIPTRYEANMNALVALLQSCREREVDVLLYIPPIRTDVEVPYDLAEYAAFKEQVQRIARQNNVCFENLEGIVPGPLWGLKGGTTTGVEPELDFMHFQAEGHRILAEALAPLTIAAP